MTWKANVVARTHQTHATPIHHVAATMTPEERPLPLLVAVLATLGVALIGIAIICDVKGVRSIARTKWEKPHGGAEADRCNIVAVVVGVVFAAVGGFLFAAAVDAFLKSLA